MGLLCPMRPMRPMSPMRPISPIPLSWHSCCSCCHWPCPLRSRSGAMSMAAATWVLPAAAPASPSAPATSTRCSAVHDRPTSAATPLHTSTASTPPTISSSTTSSAETTSAAPSARQMPSHQPSPRYAQPSKPPRSKTGTQPMPLRTRPAPRTASTPAGTPLYVCQPKSRQRLTIRVIQCLTQTLKVAPSQPLMPRRCTLASFSAAATATTPTPEPMTIATK